MADKIATLHLPGKEPVELPILSGTVGPDVIDVRKLGTQGYFTFDPGFMATGSCKSSITYIDGDQGVLLHRGYPIAQLATQASYLEVCYILLYGEAPTKTQYAEFERLVTRHTMVHEQIAFFFRGFRRDAHPMAVMCGVVSALSAFYHDALDINNEEHREICAFRLLSKMPTLAAMCYKYSIGQPFMQPRNALSYAGNFLHMMFGVPTEEYKVNPIVERAMDRIFTLHADHEQKRLHLHRASGRFFRCQPVCLYRRGDRLPVGPGPRWCQRSLPQDARRDWLRGSHSRVHRPRQGQE